jgi:hypothetical protein
VHATSTRRTLRLTIAAWITILVLTSGFQFYRDAIPDAIVFLVMAIALVVAQIPALRRLSEYRWQPRRVVVVIALAVAAAVLILTPRHGLADGIVIIGTGILVFVVAWPNPPTESAPDGATDDAADATWTPRMRRSAIAWTIVGIAFCLWELSMYFLGLGQSGRTEYPALSDLLDPALNNPYERAVFVILWLAGGVALARRGRTQPLTTTRARRQKASRAK